MRSPHSRSNPHVARSNLYIGRCKLFIVKATSNCQRKFHVF